MKTFFFRRSPNIAKTKKLHEDLFFRDHLKNLANITRRPFLTSFQFSFLDLYLKIVIIFVQQSFFIHFFKFNDLTACIYVEFRKILIGNVFLGYPVDSLDLCFTIA